MIHVYKSKKIAKEATISFIGMGFGNAVRYLFTVVLARFVGIEYLGIYSLATSVTRIGEVIGIAGLQSGVMRYVSRLDKENEIDEIRQRVRSGLMLGLIFSIVTMILQLALSDWLAIEIFQGSELLKRVIVISAFSLPFATVMIISAFATQGYQLLKYKITVINIVRPTVMLLCTLLCLGIFSKDSAIIYPLFISAIVSALVSLLFLKKLVGIKLNEIFLGKIDKELLSFSYPLMFVAILGTLLHWMDIMMLGYFTDTTTVGLYHPATRTAGLMRTILLAFMGIFSPMMSDYHRKGKLDEMRKLYKLVVRWIISLSIPFAIIMIIYSKKIMLLFGGQYVSSANVLSLLVLAAFIQSFIGSSGPTLSMAGYPKINLINSIFVLMINVVLNYVWIPLFGINGAAYATLVSISFLAVIRLIEVRMIVKIQPFSIKMLKPVIAGGIMIVVLSLLKPIVMPMHTLTSLIIVSLVGLLSFFFMLWMLKFDDDDREIWSGIGMITNRRES